MAGTLGVIGSVVGITGGVSNILNSGKSTDAAMSASNSQQAIAAQQLAMMQDQWNTYKTTFLPVGQRLADVALNTPVKPDFATVERMAGEGVKQQGDIGWQNYNRQAQDTRGAAWNPGSDNYQAALRNWNNQLAGQGAIAKQVAHTGEKNRVEDLNWNRMAQVYGLGQGIPGSANAMGSSASAGYGNAASTNMNLAGMQGQNAAMGFYGAGRALQNWNSPSTANPYNYGSSYNVTGSDWGSDPTVITGNSGWREGGPVRAIRFDDGGAVPAGFSVEPLHGEDQRQFAIWMGGTSPAGTKPGGAAAGAGGALNMSTATPGQGAVSVDRSYADGGQASGYMSPEDVAAGGKVRVPQRGGGVSTEKTITFEADGRHHVIPTIISGRSYTPDAAIQAWARGANPPIATFSNQTDADAYARSRSMQLDRAIGGPGALHMGPSDPASGGLSNSYADGGKTMALMRHPTKGAMYFADGGQITGPGSGTSDSIPTKLPAGAYVVPADVVRAKGTDFFDKMHDSDVPAEFHTGALGGGVSADVSNGEYLVAPGVVKAKGQEFFDKLLERYHTPVKKKGADSLPNSIEVAIRAHRPTAAIRKH